MASLFSMNHGSVTSVIALASSFSPDLGTQSTGVLYICYVLFAMFFAETVVFKVGKKFALVGSLGLYAIYVAAYLIAALEPSLEWPCVMAGAAIGGIGAGLLWTAQGAYFKTNAKQYGEAAGKSETEAQGLFASLFAALYLGFEVALKLIGSLVSTYAGDSGTYVIYALYTSVSVGSTMLMFSMIEPMESTTRSANALSSTQRFFAAIKLLFCNAKCALMVPTNFAFGFAVPLLTSYVQASVVYPVDGDDEDELATHNSRVLLYSSLAVGFASLISFPLGWFRTKVGTPVVMLLGASAFTLVSLAVLAIPTDDLNKVLWLFYLIYGVGRASWEGTVKGVFADFFEEKDSPAAFANIIIQSGISSAFAFLVYPYFETDVKAVLGLVAAVSGFVCYIIADRINARSPAALSVNMV